AVADVATAAHNTTLASIDRNESPSAPDAAIMPRGHTVCACRGTMGIPACCTAVACNANLGNRHAQTGPPVIVLAFFAGPQFENRERIRVSSCATSDNRTRLLPSRQARRH
ncbi:MAG: hypothetical protein WCF43_12680, partial [Steroidobacteraceae bacterium]